MISITYRNPLNHDDQVEIPVIPLNNSLARDWKIALYDLVKKNNALDKNFCFHGFPSTPRTIPFLCDELNRHVKTINESDIDYRIDEVYTEGSVRYDDSHPVAYGDLGLALNHDTMNRLHNYFEVLQGTVGNTSEYYSRADLNTKYAIRQLNLLCHEIETLALSQRKLVISPEWVRPSQITSFLRAPRFELTDEHRELFLTNGYNRKFGYVYMHWAQIGKTLMEVFRDENAPDLTKAVCDAITHLQYYSGEFDIEFGRDIVYGSHDWHTSMIDDFHGWLVYNGFTPNDTSLSLGYLPIARLDFDMVGDDIPQIWQVLGNHMDIYQIKVDDVMATYDYCWSNDDYAERMKAFL